MFAHIGKMSYLCNRKQRDNQPFINPKPNNMISLETINERGLAYIAMFIEDMVNLEGHDEEKGNGMYFEKNWATPETCYWLYRFMKEVANFPWNQEIIQRLKNGTNHPDNI